MKVELIRCRFNNGSVSYKYMPFDYCCDELKCNPCILFTNNYLVYGTFDKKGRRNYGYLPQFCTSHTEIVTSYEDEWEQTDNYPIQFCPHCSEKIEINVVDDVDLSEKYDKLSELRDRLWKECRETDSKKRAAELQKKVHNIDDEINEFYLLGEWNKEELSC